MRWRTLRVKHSGMYMPRDVRIIGHVMFSKAEIKKRDGGAIPAWTFGPISIHPDYKRMGYGLKLLKYALEKAKSMGIGVICMEGNIDFYKHAGFVVASRERTTLRKDTTLPSRTKMLSKLSKRPSR